MTTAWTSRSLTFGAFRRQWAHGRIIERNQGERLSSKDIYQRIVQRARKNPRFRSDVLEHPRYVWAIALEEGLGIKAEQFLAQVTSVRIHQETATVFYLKLPVCHGGCGHSSPAPAQEENSRSNCHVCGKPFEHAGNEPTVIDERTPIMRELIEDRLRKRAAFDPKFREDLLQRPLETYRAFAREASGGEVPLYLSQVRELVVLQEHPNEIHLIFRQTNPGAK